MTNELAIEMLAQFGIREPDPRLIARLVAMIKSAGSVMVPQAFAEHVKNDLIQKDQPTKPPGAKRGPKPKAETNNAGGTQTKAPPAEDSGDPKGSKEPEEPKENTAAEGGKE
jgi:hypothetical protein